MPESEPAALLACGWAVCPGCGETWLSDISPETPWPVIGEVADECRAHLATTGHGTSFDVGIEP